MFGGPGGQHATFNSGATIKVRTLINYGGDAASRLLDPELHRRDHQPRLRDAAPTPTPPGPSIQFIEDTAHSSPPNCAFAAAIGDTHQHTVAGLLYDFQASGDFVEAQVGSGLRGADAQGVRRAHLAGRVGQPLGCHEDGQDPGGAV